MNSDGTDISPAFSFSSSSNSGMLYDSSNEVIKFSILGTNVLNLENGFVSTPTNSILATNGSASTPSFTFIGSLSGMYQPLANQVAFACNGQNVLTLKQTAIESTKELIIQDIRLNSALSNGTSGNPVMAYIQPSTKYISSWRYLDLPITTATSDSIATRASLAGNNSFTGTNSFSNTTSFQNLRLTNNTGKILVPALDQQSIPVTNPQITFIDPTTSVDLKTGLAYRNNGGLHTLSLCAGGEQILYGSISSIHVFKQLRAPISLASPSYSFVNDTDTGLTSDAANTLKLICGGTSILNLNQSQLLLGLIGTIALPAYAFSAYPSTGISCTSNSISMSIDGIQRFVIGIDAIIMNTNATTRGITIDAETVALGAQTGSMANIGGTYIGYRSGISSTTLSSYAVAVGWQAGAVNQKSYCTSIGYKAGETDAGASSTAIGSTAGQTSLGPGSIAIGNGANRTNVNSSFQCVSIGTDAGVNAGSYSISIGRSAGSSNPSNFSNAIILNATGSALTATASSAFYVKPIRTGIAGGTAMTYVASSGEIVAASSSLRYKKDVVYKDIEYNDILKTRCVSYTTKDYEQYFNVGYIAEDFAEINEDFINRNELNQPDSLNQYNMLVYTIELCKAQQKQIQSLNETISTLKSESTRLKKIEDWIAFKFNEII